MAAQRRRYRDRRRVGRLSGAAVRNRPDLAEGRYYLATALAKVPGRLPDAIAELEVGLRIRPNPEMQHML